MALLGHLCALVSLHYYKVTRRGESMLTRQGEGSRIPFSELLSLLQRMDGDEHSRKLFFTTIMRIDLVTVGSYFLSRNEFGLDQASPFQTKLGLVGSCSLSRNRFGLDRASAFQSKLGFAGSYFLSQNRFGLDWAFAFQSNWVS
ncbi:uncharacterized protein G2W53_004431 [Senna tora]|uniref:Uncharacterized protein n=1 Tax=Senna tora TaxID=362788 RepID=A0A834XCX2_9FABA|nr:uncharacterized protein G2W53_004431 [Senna tora]